MDGADHPRQDQADARMSAPPDGLERLWTPWRHGLRERPGRSRRAARSAQPAPTDADGRARRARLRGAQQVPVQPGPPADLPLPPRRRLPRARPGRECWSWAGSPRQAMRVVRKVSGAHGFNIGHQPGRASRARASPPTCTSTWCRGGAGTATSCPWSAAPRPCPNCSPTPVSCCAARGAD